MKKLFSLSLLFVAVQINAQTLKDALYGGKLRTDSGTVLRKGEDLSSKIDTARKKTVVVEKSKPASAVSDSTGTKTAGVIDSTNPAESVPVSPINTNRDNNRIWKEFMDSAISTLNSELMSSKKLKKGDYFIILDYAIETDGKVSINNVYPSPENKMLAIEIKERLSIAAPQLNPVLGSSGKARKVTKRQNFTLTKN